MRQFTEPIIEIDQLLCASAIHREVPRMDQQVTCRYLDLPMQSMGIGDQHNYKMVKLWHFGLLPYVLFSNPWMRRMQNGFPNVIHYPKRFGYAGDTLLGS
jgi:hypothetical protein